MKKLGKYGKKVSCVVIGMLCAAAIGACGSTQSGSQDEKDVRNDISVYEEGADLEGTLTYGTLFIEPQTQHMIDLFMKEHPGVKIETKVVFDNDVTDEQYNEGLNTLLTELASDQRADIYDATYLPSEIKTKGSGYFEDLNQYIDADPNFNRDDYYDNILRAAEVDGKLYQIPEGFYYVMLRLNRNITDELNYEVPDEMDINDLYELYQQSRTIALFYCLLAFSHCIAAILRGSGNASVPMIVMLCDWCLFRVSYITVAVRILPDIRVIFWAYPLTWGISSVIFLYLFLRGKWVYGFEKS